LQNDDYYSFYLNITIPSIGECNAGGPYLLSVGVQNATDKSRYQYYTINAINNSRDIMYQFINYNSSSFTLNVTVNNHTQYINPFDYSDIVSYNFSKYDDVRLSFGVDEAINDQKYYVVLSEYNVSAEYNVLACKSQRLSEFSSFGWKAWNYNTSKGAEFLPNLYFVQVYWSANQDWSYIQSNMDLYQLNLAYTYKIAIGYDFYPPIRIVNKTLPSLSRGSELPITFATSFNLTTELYAYFEQCTRKGSSTTCQSYRDKKKNFTYSEYETTTSVSIPGELTVSSDNVNLTTYLHVYTENCANTSIIEYVFDVNITGSSSKSSSLPPGAIVGIVCAGVLVLGLAAWWICMKRPGNDSTYRKLDE